MCVPNLKQIALFVQKLLGSQILLHCRLPSQVTGPPKFNQLEMVTTCTYRPSLVKVDARNFELLWYTARPPATITHRQD